MSERYETKVTEEWTLCFKTAPAFVRTVKGEKEEVNTREGITWAYAETDFVMCGPDEMGLPDASDVYPIKKTRFQETYIGERERVEGKTLICSNNGKSATINITIKGTIHTADRGTPERLEEYEFNPQRGRNILSVLGDPEDERTYWSTDKIQCSACDEILLSVGDIINHFAYEGET